MPEEAGGAKTGSERKSRSDTGRIPQRQRLSQKQPPAQEGSSTCALPSGPPNSLLFWTRSCHIRVVQELQHMSTFRGEHPWPTGPPGPERADPVVSLPAADFSRLLPRQSLPESNKTIAICPLFRIGNMPRRAETPTSASEPSSSFPLHMVARRARYLLSFITNISLHA